MKLDKLFFIIVLILAWGWLIGANVAQAQPSPVLNVKLSKAVSAVVDPTGVEVHLWCDYGLDPWSTLGNRTGREAWVSLGRCKQAEFLAEGRRPKVAKSKQDFAEALGYLLRAGNMAVGIGDVDLATCKAAQQVELLARELGVSRGYARNLADLNWEFIFKREECYPGGPFDFGLGHWPKAAYLPPEIGDEGGKG